MAFFVAVALAQGVYEHEIGAAFAKAKKQKKPLWIMVSATWCGPCKFVEKEVFPDKRFQEALLKDFVPLHVFASSGEESTPGGDSLAKVYRVRAFPTFLCVEPNGELFFRSEGVPNGKGPEDSPVEGMLRNLEFAKKARKDLPAFRKRYQKGDRSLEFLRSYLFLLIELALKDELKAILQDYLKVAGSVQQAWLAEPGLVWRLFTLVKADPTQSEYAFQIADTLRQHLTPSEWEALYEPISRIHFDHTLRKELPVGADAYTVLEKLRAYIRRYQKTFPAVEYIALEQLWSRWLVHPTDSVRRRLAADLAVEATFLRWPLEIPDAEQRGRIAERLNIVAWDFYKHVDSPDKLWVAVGWTKQALAYKPEAWHIWDTLGALYYKLGRKAHAIQALQKAIQLARDNQVPEAEYQETQQLLEQAQSLPD